MAKIRVLIVDDVSNVRQDLRTLLTLAGESDIRRQEDKVSMKGSAGECQNTMEIVGEAVDGLEAIRQVETLQPDVVLLDLEMPVADGYEAAGQIKNRFPACRVIALSVHDYESAREKAIRAGIDAFIVKGAPVETLMQAIFSPSK